MEDIKKEIGEVLNAFAQQELGNKITQFNLQGLAMILESAIDKVESERAKATPKKK